MEAGAWVVRGARAEDVPAMTALQNALIAETAVEWTEHLHTVDERCAWLREQERRGFATLVAVASGRVVGWCGYGDFRDSVKWPGYRYTVEHTIHVERAYWGRGIARDLMSALLGRARDAGLHAVVGAIDANNAASLRFHERMGFVEVGRMREIGAKFGRWLDLVFMQYTLDTRFAPSDPRPPDPAACSKLAAS